MGAPVYLRYSCRISHSSTHFTRILPRSINEEVVGGYKDACVFSDGSNYRPYFACKLHGFVKFHSVQDAAVCGGYVCLSVCLRPRKSY